MAGRTVRAVPRPARIARRLKAKFERLPTPAAWWPLSPLGRAAAAAASAETNTPTTDNFPLTGDEGDFNNG